MSNTPFDHYSQNIDNRSAVDTFKSMCNAIKKHDAARVAGDDCTAETWWNIFSCEAMRCARDSEDGPELLKLLEKAEEK